MHQHINIKYFLHYYYEKVISKTNFMLFFSAKESMYPNQDLTGYN